MSNESARMFAAQAAIRAGRKEQARGFLQEEVEHNTQNFRAWLWLGGLADSAQESLDYVRQAERLNPDDPGVEKALAWAEQRLARQNRSRFVAQAETVSSVQRPTPEPDSESEGDVAQRVAALGEQRRAEKNKWRPSRRALFLGALTVFVCALVVMSLLWGDSVPELAFGARGMEASNPDLSAPTATPTPHSETDDQGAQVVALSFVSGQFAPAMQNAEPTAVEAPTQEATATPIPMQPKPVSKTSNNPRPTWTLTPSPTFTPTATPTPVPTFVSEELAIVGGAVRPSGVGPNERWIDVNLSTQRLVAYEGDHAVFNTLVSSGTWLHPTVTGQFRVWLRYTAQTMDGRRLGYDYYLPNVPYVMYFYRDYALHGTYWHNNFGTPMSHGCVNLPTPAAEWIFNWSSIGTMVNVHY